MKATNLLSKYDEEIDGVKRESFKLGKFYSCKISSKSNLDLICKTPEKT